MNRIKRYEKTHPKMLSSVNWKAGRRLQRQEDKDYLFWVDICVVYRCISLLVLL